jgi:hypothetical protein
MHDDDDEELSPQEIAARAFGGMKDRVDEYKADVRALRRGKSSGISGFFGNATEILPPEYLDEYGRVNRETAAGDCVVKGDVGRLRGLVEDMIAAFHETEDEQDFAGVFFDEDGNKQYLFADLNGHLDTTEIQEAAPIETETNATPDAPLKKWRNSREMILQSDLTNSGMFRALLEEDEEDEAQGEPEAETLPAQAVISTDEQLSDQERDQTFDDVEISPKKTYSEQPIDQRNRQSTVGPEISVFTSEQIWLWDIYFRDGAVERIAMADGSEILRTVEKNQYILMSAPKESSRIPEIQVIGAVACQAETGNIFYYTASGDRAFALFNNGWTIEQVKSAGGDEYYITPPAIPAEVPPEPLKASSISIDPDKHQFSYELSDGTSATVSFNQHAHS